ncbi:MAG: ABC transporter permease [bacterium]|nr:ABC transporter permease [bacterium]
MTPRTIYHRLLALITKSRHERELENEIRAHLELAERDARASGMSAEEARNAARRSFGGVEQMKEVHRDQRSSLWIENLVRDIRYGLASLRRNPGFAAVAIGVLALGIGANTAMFSLVDAVLLKPLPFPEPDRIVRVWETPAPGDRNATTTLDFIDWKRLNNSFEALSAYSTTNASLTGDGEPTRFSGYHVSADYFEVFGIQARIGRTFVTEEDQPGASPVVVLSNKAWQTRFGGDTDILDRELILDGEVHRVIGVLPPGSFDRETGGFWKPLIFTPPQRTRASHWLRVMGRLRDGVSLEQAQEEMLAIDAQLTELSPPWKREWSVMVEPFDERLFYGNLHESIYLAFGAVALVLLIACANVTNLLLARGAARKKELAVRAALGAGRGRLIRQLLTEGLVLCFLGAVAGVALAGLLTRVVIPLLFRSLPATAEVGLDLRVLAFAAAITIPVFLLVSLIPSLQTSFVKLSHALNQVSRGSSFSREGLRRTIVVGEVAISLVLICGASLLFKSLLKLQQVDTGVRIQNVITMALDLPLAAYPTPASATQFYEAVVARVEAVPGVEHASLSTDLPLQQIWQGEAMLTLAYDADISIRYKRVDSHYFEALEIPLIAGRGLTDRDIADAPRVVVVNETLAASLSDRFKFPNPIDEIVYMTDPAYVKLEGGLTETQIVGIIRSERVGRPGIEDDPVAYVSLAQSPTLRVKLIVHTLGEPATVMPGLRKAVSQVAPNLALGDVSTMEQVKEQSLSGASQSASVIGAFAILAAFLAALGLYGVLSHVVTQRRREVGIRMAMGAGSGAVLSHILQNGLAMVVAGLLLGLAGSVALTRVMGNLLFEVSALDPLTFVLASASMLLVGLFACLIPAARAARVDPVIVLRDEG